MPDSDLTQSPGDGNILDYIALFKLGKIKRADISPDNQAVLNFYLGLLEENSKFAAQVRTRMNQLNDYGRKTPLYTAEQIKALKKKRRKKAKQREFACQLNLWPLTLSQETAGYGLENVRDPERGIFKTGQKLNSRRAYIRQTVYTEDIRRKKAELRGLIGLPIARGKDPHVNDPLYKYLVKNICDFDVFGIFKEYDRVLTDIPKDLELKINEIKGLVEELLDERIGRRQFFRRYKEFLEGFRTRWNIPG